MTATVAVMPGIALAGETAISEKTSMSEAKERSPSRSTISWTAISSP